MVFTGLVAAVGKSRFLEQADGACRRLMVEAEGFFKDVALGDSIAVNGCCLTAVEFSDDWAAFDVMAESLRLTSLADRSRVNLEKAMLNSSRLGGHIVQGHVHGVGTLVERTPVGSCDSVDFWFSVPARKPDQILKHKGSIAIDGVSLTVAEVRNSGDSGPRVRVSIIPHTRKATTFGVLEVGDRVNIEYQNADTEGAAHLDTSDEYFMSQALIEGEKGRTTAPPNPWVGAVVVKDGVIIGRGYHHKAGEPHAEVNALRDCARKEDIEGSTVYCTLEPCSHHGRTGPCCEALVAAKVKRCVVGVRDPDVKVSGRGIAHMEQHGIQVAAASVELAEASLAPYLHMRRTGRPYVVVKIASTLDGKVGCVDKTSQWITGRPARSQGQVIRKQSQAVIVGSGTALADNPRLTVRERDEATGKETESQQQPLRVLIDRRGRTAGHKLHLFDADAAARTLVITEQPGAYKALDGNPKVEVLAREKWELGGVLHELAARGFLQVMVEGGGQLQTAFMQSNLVDLYVLFFGATMFGPAGIPWLQTDLCSTIKDARFLKLESVEKLGNDVKLVYKPDGDRPE
ncbi:Riboflavin biosynthesis protein RibD [Diplonema papillatum]|nr:Riboflavin biosynthesis protein RibD [Diplonema papillatum]